MQSKSYRVAFSGFWTVLVLFLFVSLLFAGISLLNNALVEGRNLYTLGSGDKLLVALWGQYVISIFLTVATISLIRIFLDKEFIRSKKLNEMAGISVIVLVIVNLLATNSSWFALYALEVQNGIFSLAFIVLALKVMSHVKVETVTYAELTNSTLLKPDRADFEPGRIRSKGGAY